MIFNISGAFVRNAPFGTETAFAKGLIELGHTVNAVDASVNRKQGFIEDADATIVFKTAEGMNEQLLNVKGVKIVYQPDDLRFPHIRSMVEEMRKYCDSIFTFDKTCSLIAKDIGYFNSEVLHLTADDSLYKPYIGHEKDIDLCFIGSMGGGANHVSRRWMLNKLSEAGFNVGIAKDIYDPVKIAKLYRRSKVVLNHATDVGQKFGTGYGYQCRHYEAGFAGSCILSNMVLDEEEYGEEKLVNFIRFYDEASLLQFAKELLENQSMRESMAASLYSELCEKHRPVHRAKKIVSFVEDWA